MNRKLLSLLLILIISLQTSLAVAEWDYDDLYDPPVNYTWVDQEAYWYVYLDDDRISIGGYSGPTTELVIPEELFDCRVTSVGLYWHNPFDTTTFRTLTSVIIPDSVTCIGYYAFACCPELTSVILPDSITDIGAAAFGECISLQSIVLPKNLTHVDNATFSCCISLTDVKLPAGLISIGDYAFDSCLSLTSLTIPASVNFIGEDAFANCPSLTVTVTRGSYAEQYCVTNAIPFTYVD